MAESLFGRIRGRFNLRTIQDLGGRVWGRDENTGERVWCSPLQDIRNVVFRQRVEGDVTDVSLGGDSSRRQAEFDYRYRSIVWLWHTQESPEKRRKGGKNIRVEFGVYYWVSNQESNESGNSYQMLDIALNKCNWLRGVAHSPKSVSDILRNRDFPNADLTSPTKSYEGGGFMGVSQNEINEFTFRDAEWKLNVNGRVKEVGNLVNLMTYPYSQ